MEKNEIRRLMSSRKKDYTKEEIRDKSAMLMNHLEENTVFISSKTAMLYYSLPDEVYTHEFIEKWYKEKTIVLPVVIGDEMILKVYDGKESMKKGAYNIYEPTGTEFTDYSSIDMAIIPGVAFDAKGNRLGRGKGYYDRFLRKVKTFKLGICFDFQLYNDIPTDLFDIPMDDVCTENGYINKKLYQK